MAVEAQLQAAVVEHKTFDQLTDIVTEKNLDLENAFIPETLELANNSNDEMWRQQWDAVLNLRILNKFYYQAFESLIDQLSNFIKGQIENLRSNNSRNALALFHEVFSQNSDKSPDGLKTSDTWAVFLEANYATVFARVNADKKFISMVAQKGVLAAAEVSPIPPTINVLIKNSSSKSLVLAEFAVRSLEALVKTANPAFFHEQQHEE